MVAAAACDDGPQPTATEAVHPALEKAVATLRNTRSFGFVERRSESIGGISLEFGETGFEATGNYQSPDRFTKRALVSEFPVQPAIPARSINVGEERYLIDPATGEWMLIHEDLGLQLPTRPLEEDLVQQPPGASQQGDTATHRRRGHLPQSASRASPGWGYPGRTARRMGHRPTLHDTRGLQHRRSSTRGGYREGSGIDVFNRMTLSLTPLDGT